MSIRLTKFVDVEAEVTVDVSATDIAEALRADADSVRAAMHCLNSVACVMNGITDEIIAQMSEQNRTMVLEFLRTQSGRFAAPEPSE